MAVGFSLALAAQQARALEVSIATLTGQDVTGDLEKIENGIAHLVGGSTVAMAEIRSIHFPTSSGRPTGPETVFLSCGSVITGNTAILTEKEDISVQMAIGGSAEFPIDAVRGVRLLPTRKDSLFERQLAGDGDAENDRVFVPQESELRELAGVLESLGADQISIDRDG